MKKAGNQGWNPHKKTRQLTRNCLYCQTEFKTWPSIDSKYCSNSCKNRHLLQTKQIWNKGKRAGEGNDLVSGSRHWNWKGGVTSKNMVERNKFAKYIQPKILKRDKYTCQLCHKHGGRLHVDHIKSWAKYPELRFDESNCRTLCVPCHYLVTFNKVMPSDMVWGNNYVKESLLS